MQASVVPFLYLPCFLTSLHTYVCFTTHQHRVVHALGTDRRTVEGVWEICKGW